MDYKKLIPVSINKNINNVYNIILYYNILNW